MLPRQSFSRYNYHDNSFYSWSAHDLSSVSITGGSHRYLSSVHPHLSSVSLICITHRYLSPVSLIGISHHVTHLNYVWRICCQVNHSRDIIITITHFLLKVRMWSICQKYVLSVPLTGIHHRYLSSLSLTMQVNHFRDIIITITHFILEVRMISRRYLSPAAPIGISHRYLRISHRYLSSV